MGHKAHIIGFLLTCISLTQVVSAQDATWTGQTNTGLNTGTNWTGNNTPTSIATFDSNLPPSNFTPMANNAVFTIESFYFPHSASDFEFTFTGPLGYLTFTGAGITGTNTNTQITGTNSGMTPMASPQLFINPDSSSPSVSLGRATLSFTNESGATINPISNNVAQILFADSDSFPVIPITSGDAVSISVTNNGTIQGGNEAAQIFLKGSSFTAGDNLMLNAINDSGGLIETHSDTGQLVFDANGGGRYSNFYCRKQCPTYFYQWQ